MGRLDASKQLPHPIICCLREQELGKMELASLKMTKAGAPDMPERFGLSKKGMLTRHYYTGLAP